MPADYSNLMIYRKRPQAHVPPVPVLVHRRFRANADYRLVAHAELGASERDLFARLAKNEDHYGLLIPRQFLQAGVKAIDNDVARLFRLLADPGPLPPIFSDVDPLYLNSRIAGLVLDSVLEVEIHGHYLTGPAASGLVPEVGARSYATRTLPTPSVLSRDALQLAAVLPLEDPAQLSAWIYAYNAIPLGPAWLRRLGVTDRVNERLGLHPGGHNHRRLTGNFLTTPTEAWLSWSRRDRDGLCHDGHLGYKLYISPHPNSLIEAFDSVIEVIAASDVTAFKLGKGAYGLLRPDKLVIYFDGWESLYALAVDMEKALAGVTAQGVPFTAGLTEDGLLSWGMDPPADARLSGWGEMESWRFWLTNQLARALLSARSSGGDAKQCLTYATARLRLEGIDTDLWIPADTLWAETGVGV